MLLAGDVSTRNYALLRMVGWSGEWDHRLMSEGFSGALVITHMRSLKIDKKTPQKTDFYHGM